MPLLAPAGAVNLRWEVKIPATSRAQFRFFKAMQANPAEARAKGITPKVANEFAQAPGGTLKGLPEKRAEKKAKPRRFGALAP